MARGAMLIVDSNQLLRERLKQLLKTCFVVSERRENLAEAIEEADPGKFTNLGRKAHARKNAR